MFSLRLQPSLHFRPHEAPVNTILGGHMLLSLRS